MKFDFSIVARIDFVRRLEPLLARIKEKPNVVTCPAVDNIDDKTLEYSKNGGVSIGGFTWSLHFTWRAVPMKDRQRSDADPIKSAVLKVTVLLVRYSKIGIKKLFRFWKLTLLSFFKR